MFCHNLNDKQKGDKKQESNQDFIASFVDPLVERFVLSVSEIRSDYKSNKKDSGESPLTSCEHLFQIFNKFTQMYLKVVFCINN